MPELRPYQTECISALVNYRRKPVEGGAGARALVGLPTGCGKTVIFAQLPKLAKGRTMVIAHREELLDQAAGHLSSNNPGKGVAVEQADRSAGAADVVVASIQTLAWGGGQRLQRFDPQDFSLIIVDEAHHATARTYIQTLHHFGLAPDVSDLKDSDLGRRKLTKELQARFDDYQPAHDGPFLAGFTATPHRTDGQGLEVVFDEIVYSQTIESMIKQGWLCPVRGKLVDTGVDISQVKKRMGDYQESQLSSTVNTPERNRLAVQAYLEHAVNRQALVFCVDVEHAVAMADTWRKAGVPTGVVTGETPSRERRAILAAYKQGDLRALSNCMVLTEGFDAPETACVVMARPTSSGLLYTQMLGRGTRLAPGKADLLVIDLVDMASKGAVVQSANTLFGLPPKLQLGDTDTVEAKRLIEEEAEGKLPLFMLDEIESIAEIKSRVRDFNPLLAQKYDPSLAGTTLTWIGTSYGYTCSLMAEGNLGVVSDLLGHAWVRYQKRGQATKLLKDGFKNNLEAIRWAEGWVRGDAPDEVKAVAGAARRDAKWHGDPATDKQLNMLRRLSVLIPDGVTKGWAAALITDAMEKPGNARRARGMEMARQRRERGENDD